jgi:hypothetical protein
VSGEDRLVETGCAGQAFDDLGKLVVGDRGKEFGSGTAVHLSLQSFEAVNLTFGLPIAPKLADGIPDRGQIMPSRIGESA